MDTEIQPHLDPTAVEPQTHFEIRAPEPVASLPAPLLQTTKIFRRSGTISVMNRCVAGCELCDVLNCVTHSELSIEAIDQKLAAVAASGKHWATFPPNTLLSEHCDAISALARCQALIPVLRIHPSVGIRANWPKIVNWLKDGGEIEAVFDDVWEETELQSLRRAFQVLPERIRIVVTPRRGTDVFGIFASLPEPMALSAQFMFPIPGKADRLGCDEIHALITNLKSVFPDITIKPNANFEVEDSTLPDWFPPQISTEPILQSASLNPAPQVSIIIASYNRKEELINGLRHLQRQTLNADFFELIIVDDGSDDGTLERIRQHFVRTPARFNFKYYLLPRPYARKRGDDLYRAAYVKNFGAEKSSGSILAFLDPEVLVSTNFANDVLIQHRDAAVVQYPARKVPFAKATQRPRYSELSEKTYAIEKQGAWKLGAGLCLTVSRELFYDVGGFSRAFHTFGFEDVLLVWQMNRLGAKLKDASEPVYFLEPSAEESEFKNSRAIKRKVLSRSAQTFYALTLDEDFYNAYFPLLGSFLRVRQTMQFLSRSQLGRVLLMPFYGVLLVWREPQRGKDFIRKFKR